MQFSVSRVQAYLSCPYKFKLKYLDKLVTFPNYDDPANALFLGTALHTGLEQDVEKAVESYYNSYPIITDLHVNEAIKLEKLIPKAKAMIPFGENEVLLENEVFKGFIDLLVDKGNGHFDIWDFKYSNNVEHYLESFQLHVYKAYLEAFNHVKVDNLYFLFIPKTGIRQKKTEDLTQFRKRLDSELDKMTCKVVEVKADESKFQEFLEGCNTIEKADTFPKQETRLCQWCEFKEFCLEGNDLYIDWNNTPFMNGENYKIGETL